MFSAVLVVFGDREAGCFRQVAALHSDHYRQVPVVRQGWSEHLTMKTLVSGCDGNQYGEQWNYTV